MKRLLFRKRMDAKKRIKVLSFGQRFEDATSKTQVKKNFSYKLFKSEDLTPQQEAPQIFIRKSFDTKRAMEKFHFRVKGYYYITHNRVLFKVYFRHTLKIKVQWKSKAFSPKKSEILT